MNELITKLSAMDWAALIAIIVAGGFVLVNAFGKGFKEKRDTADKVDDRLINLLKGTVDELERKVKALEDQQAVNVTEIQGLKGENDVMKKILQGRDQASIDAAKDVKDTLIVVTQTQRNFDRLTKIMEDHLQFIEKLMQEMKAQNIPIKINGGSVPPKMKTNE